MKTYDTALVELAAMMAWLDASNGAFQYLRVAGSIADSVAEIGLTDPTPKGRDTMKATRDEVIQEMLGVLRGIVVWDRPNSATSSKNVQLWLELIARARAVIAKVESNT